MTFQLANQMISSIKALNLVNTVTPIIHHNQYIVYIPVTFGVCTFVLFSYSVIHDSYRDNHPFNIYDELIIDGINRGILDPATNSDSATNNDIELQVINRNETAILNEESQVPFTNTPSQINTTQNISNLSRSSQDINNRNNLLESGDKNHFIIEMGLSEMIRGTTSMKNEKLKNTNNSSIVEEINKKRLSSDNFKKPHSSDDIDLGVD
jgi:hypothetical protein